MLDATCVAVSVLWINIYEFIISTKKNAIWDAKTGIFITISYKFRETNVIKRTMSTNSAQEQQTRQNPGRKIDIM